MWQLQDKPLYFWYIQGTWGFTGNLFFILRYIEGTCISESVLLGLIVPLSTFHEKVFIFLPLPLYLPLFLHLLWVLSGSDPPRRRQAQSPAVELPKLSSPASLDRVSEMQSRCPPGSPPPIHLPRANAFPRWVCWCQGGVLVDSTCSYRGIHSAERRLGLVKNEQKAVTSSSVLSAPPHPV